MIKLKVVQYLIIDVRIKFFREYMLAVILHVTLELLKEGPPDNRDSTLGGILANTLLKVHTVYPGVCPYSQFMLNIDSVGVLPASIHGV